MPQGDKSRYTDKQKRQAAHIEAGYETAIKTDKFVLIAQGSVADIDRAKQILGQTKPETLEHHP